MTDEGDIGYVRTRGAKEVGFELEISGAWWGQGAVAGLVVRSTSRDRGSR